MNARNLETGILPAIQEENSRLKEQITPSNRVVVFGSRLSGALVLADEFKQYLVEYGIPNSLVATCRNVEMIEDAFFDRRPIVPDAPPYTPTLPKGVIVFPEMRMIRSVGLAMTIPTPFGYIKDLCDKYGVPVVLVGIKGEPVTPEQSSQNVMKVLTSPCKDSDVTI